MDHVTCWGTMTESRERVVNKTRSVFSGHSSEKEPDKQSACEASELASVQVRAGRGLTQGIPNLARDAGSLCPGNNVKFVIEIEK